MIIPLLRDVLITAYQWQHSHPRVWIPILGVICWVLVIALAKLAWDVSRWLLA